MWAPIIARAAEIVESYNIPVTLRQLFYRLVMEELLANAVSPYKGLSERTAALRRRGDFPALFDRTRRVLRPASWADPVDALGSLACQYRVDRTLGQDMSVFIGVEKNALAGLLEEWFDEFGVPVLPLGGYGSESLERDVREHLARDGRKAALIYAGDFDASGMDIGRSFIEHTADCWEQTVRVGLSEQQLIADGFPVLAGKPADSRASGFIAAHPTIHGLHDFGRDDTGRRIPVQVELDAVDPAVLRDQLLGAMRQFWDESIYREVLVEEASGRAALEQHVALAESGWPT